jgi:hypothetical protein
MMRMRAGVYMAATTIVVRAKTVDAVSSEPNAGVEGTKLTMKPNLTIWISR